MSGETKKKYEFTGETLLFEGHMLKRIRYLTRSIFYEKGDVGGWIESESNLSHEGECCVSGNAKVFGNARVMENSLMNGHAILKDNAQITGDAFISNHAIVGGDSIISDNAWIRGTSKVFFYAQVVDENNNDEFLCQPHVSGDSCISGDSVIEATGSIKDSMLHHVSLYGHLTLVDGTVES